MDRLEKLKRFLQKNYPNIQAFNTRNWCGDKMETVYEEGGIIVDYCAGWNYIEIFGLPNNEFNSLFDEGDGAGDYIKTFTFEDDEMTKRKKAFMKSNKKAEIVDSYFYAIDELSIVSDELIKTKVELEKARIEIAKLQKRLNKKENPYHEKYMNMTVYEAMDRIREIDEAEMREIPFGELVYISTYLAPKVKEMMENIKSLEEVA